MIDEKVSFASVRASRGKFVRAALFEQNRAYLVGSFPLLKDQLTGRPTAPSPDHPIRADGMIWAMHELIDAREPYAALLDWYQSETVRLRMMVAP